MIISVGTFLTTIILSIHAKRTSCKLPPPACRSLMFGYVACWVYVHPPPALASLWNELDVSVFFQFYQYIYHLRYWIYFNIAYFKSDPKHLRNNRKNSLALASDAMSDIELSKTNAVRFFYFVPRFYRSFLLFCVSNSV